MFRSCVNPIVKIVLAPILLLFYLKVTGHPLPILAPMFVVILLTTIPSKPPMSLVVQLVVVLLLMSFGMVFVVQMFAGSPTGFALVCWSIFTWSYHRSHHNPQDIISNLALIVLIIATVVSKQMHFPIAGLPLIIFQAFALALVVTFVMHILLPGDLQDIKRDEPAQGIESHLRVAMLKATAMCLVLVALIGIGSSQTMLIAITVSSMLKLPLIDHQKDYVYQRLITTATGILFTIPTMLLCGFGAPEWVVMGVSLFLGIQLACYAIRRDAHAAIYQLLLTNFVVLTYQAIKNVGLDSFSSGIMRLASISIAIFIGALILRLISPRQHSIKGNNVAS
ncbi:DUF2955 domain-containing protein [Vibrio furnissii]|uniref:DUF2955 domain-containing protein n=1 Tax=Vibrio furnissii TaxID=29494 RepID=UPI000200CAF1|nr:DUF2955 domain-containing protein [Vibrio furnissii]ADT86468.1 Permease of the major facilitator superfamily [Vibrio furnissii NCTC 11218]